VKTCRKPLFAPVAAAAVTMAAFLPGAAGAQMDMELMMYWGQATVIRWSVVGDYEGDDLILNVGTSGYAPVKDHVEITFETTTEGDGGLVGTPAIVNFPSEMGPMRNGAEGCRAPTVSGPYEHATVERVENGLGGQLAMTVRREYPEGKVPVACTGGDQASPKHVSTDRVDLVVPGIALLAMGDQAASETLQIAADRKSLVVRDDGWTYTYTPTKVR
jgi:hypothetical protein